MPKFRIYIYIYIYIYMHIDRQINRQIGRQIDRQTDRLKELRNLRKNWLVIEEGNTPKYFKMF